MSRLPADAGLAAACCGASVLPFEPPAQSSRRRRLWELEGHAHCPVVGVCLPIAALRKLFERVRGSVVPRDDYELHCDAMTECKRRSPLAEAMQKEFDRRYALALQQSAKLKTTESLDDWWHAARDGGDLPGAVWATLTHPRCTPALEHHVLGQVHMLQHQVGSAQRVERARFDAALQEVADLRREIAAQHERATRQAAHHAREIEQQQTRLLIARAETLRRDTAYLALQDEHDRLQASVHDLAPRADLAAENAAQRRRIGELERALAQAQDDAGRQRRLVDAANHAAPLVLATPAESDAVAPPDAAAPLDDRAVLCVGGRPASVPLYRRIVERTGGRFLHHDGGDEQSVTRLETTLAAADLVICQTGCISHDAYWRVKDHCKRTGTPCVFVENPGTASLKRALAELKPVSAA